MLESKIWEEAEQKSKVFLRQVMGEETFNEFIKNGKIQVKSGNTTYELYVGGNVINITTNEKYCIVPDRSDYPSYDIIAIKFAWLKYGQKTVEKVANRTTNLRITGYDVDVTRRQQEGTPSYQEFVHYMESIGWAREQVTLDERNTGVVATHAVERGNTGTAVEIRCPAGRSITIMGMNQVPLGADFRVSHSIVLKIADKEDTEISGDTLVTIDKVRPSELIRLIARGPYSSFSLTRQVGNATFGIRAYKTDNEWYRWRSGIQLMGNDALRINIVNSPIDITRKSIKMNMETDLWAR
jgi:hypothetical protein